VKSNRKAMKTAARGRERGKGKTRCGKMDGKRYAKSPARIGLEKGLDNQKSEERCGTAGVRWKAGVRRVVGEGRGGVPSSCTKAGGPSAWVELSKPRQAVSREGPQGDGLKKKKTLGRSCLANPGPHPARMGRGAGSQGCRGPVPSFLCKQAESGGSKRASE
jgi:hypothetical protein